LFQAVLQRCCQQLVVFQPKSQQLGKLPRNANYHLACPPFLIVIVLARSVNTFSRDLLILLNLHSDDVQALLRVLSAKERVNDYKDNAEWATVWRRSTWAGFG
jgi:hypothetical protein